MAVIPVGTPTMPNWLGCTLPGEPKPGPGKELAMSLLHGKSRQGAYLRAKLGRLEGAVRSTIGRNHRSVRSCSLEAAIVSASAHGVPAVQFRSCSPDKTSQDYAVGTLQLNSGQPILGVPPRPSHLSTGQPKLRANPDQAFRSFPHSGSCGLTAK